MPGKSTRSKTKVEQRREEVTFAFLQGATMRELAKQYGVNPSQITRDLQKVREVWAERYTAAIDEQKRQELAKIDHVERVAWRGYKPTGDIRYLAEVRWCIEQRCKLYGLYAPAKQEHSGVDGGPIRTETTHDLSGLDLEELHALRDIIAKTTAN